jgi:hypothetical protein
MNHVLPMQFINRMKGIFKKINKDEDNGIGSHERKL